MYIYIVRYLIPKFQQHPPPTTVHLVLPVHGLQGFMHINEAKTSWGRTSFLLAQVKVWETLVQRTVLMLSTTGRFWKDLGIFEWRFNASACAGCVGHGWYRNRRQHYAIYKLNFDFCCVPCSPWCQSMWTYVTHKATKTGRDRGPVCDGGLSCTTAHSHPRLSIARCRASKDTHWSDLPKGAAGSWYWFLWISLGPSWKWLERCTRSTSTHHPFPAWNGWNMKTSNSDLTNWMVNH